MTKSQIMPVATRAIKQAIIVTAFLLAVLSCSPDREALILNHREERESSAPVNSVEATLHQFSTDNNNLDFLLTISNSTAESIKLLTSAETRCFDETFWFYAKTSLGWKPIPPSSSFKCFPEIDNDSHIEIPAGVERDYTIGFLIGSRGLNIFDPAHYVIRIRYLNAENLPFFIFSDEFQYGSPVSTSTAQHIGVENVEGSPLVFRFMNHSANPVWLSPMCRSIHLASGWIDEQNSGLQRLTEENSWANIRTPTDECSQTNELIEIKAGETKTVDGYSWLQDAELSLQSGIYRWDIVIFLNKVSELGVEDGRHVFSDAFEYRN